MPFKSQSQRKYLWMMYHRDPKKYAFVPDFEAMTKSPSRLPSHVSRSMYRRSRRSTAKSKSRKVTSKRRSRRSRRSPTKSKRRKVTSKRRSRRLQLYTNIL